MKAIKKNKIKSFFLVLTIITSLSNDSIMKPEILERYPNISQSFGHRHPTTYPVYFQFVERSHDMNFQISCAKFQREKKKSSYLLLSNMVHLS